MTRLLVSVRDVAEARTALEVGVDLLDLKEPNRGPLGAVNATTVREVVDLVAGRVPVSIALGELLDLPTDPRSSLAISRGIAYIKLGLAGCTSHPNWISRWQEIIDAAPPSAAPVAVIYADGASVAAPSAEEILEAASQVGCRAVLVDTAVKNGRGLLDHWPPALLREFLAAARERRLTTVIGGGLTLETIPIAAASGPDYVAVRGAACSGSRTSALCAVALRAVKDAVAGQVVR